MPPGERPSDPETRSENRQIARAAGVVSVLTLLSRTTGLIRDVVVSYLFGAGFAAEAFFVAFRFPNLFRRLAAEGAMAVAFVPVFSQYAALQSEEESWRALRATLGVSLLILSIAVVGGTLLAPIWVAFFAPGFSDDPQLMQLTVDLTRLLFPYIGLIGVVALLAGFLNATGHFIAPALSPAVLNVVMIACAVSLASLLRVPVYALAIGLLLGGVAQLVTQVLTLSARGVPITPRWEPRHDAVRQIGRRMLPTLAGQAVFQINVLVGTILASFLPLGSVSHLWYATRLFEFPLGLFASALGTAALPSLSRQSALKEYGEVRNSLTFAIGVNTYLAVPAALGLIVLATPITSLLFERGAFGPEDTRLTASALRCFAVGLWAVSIKRLLALALFAVGDTRTPVVASLISMVINILASIALMGPVITRSGAPGAGLLASLQSVIGLYDLGHNGLALATSIAAILSAVPLGFALRRQLGGFGVRPILGALARSAVASMFMALVLGAALATLETPGSTSLVLRSATLATLIALGIVAFAVVAILLGGPEVERGRAFAQQQLNRVRNRSR